MFSGIDRLLFILENTGKKYNVEKRRRRRAHGRACGAAAVFWIFCVPRGAADADQRSFMDLGGDFSDGLCIELGGEKLSIAPMVGSSALKICCRSGDSETSRELVSSLKKLCSDAEKRLVSEGK